ncbi:MAG: hypothetical protein IKK33_00585 [Lachnospiraceae bacterium]|nr:hypothetical protein [Lachnospiraceae bacterium]
MWQYLNRYVNSEKRIKLASRQWEETAGMLLCEQILQINNGGQLWLIGKEILNIHFMIHQYI